MLRPIPSSRSALQTNQGAGQGGKVCLLISSTHHAKTHFRLNNLNIIYMTCVQTAPGRVYLRQSYFSLQGLYTDILVNLFSVFHKAFLFIEH